MWYLLFWSKEPTLESCHSCALIDFWLVELFNKQRNVVLLRGASAETTAALFFPSVGFELIIALLSRPEPANVVNGSCRQ